MKKALSIMAMLAMVTVLGGCSSSKPAEEAKPEETKAEAEVQERAFQNGSLIVWCWCLGNGSPELTASFIEIICRLSIHSSIHPFIPGFL